jgi:D-alanyl-D-alanine carboxypeptidase/D-alanyl-D-alanine-endopeptidase (penicillin-binding protein 4)
MHAGKTSPFYSASLPILGIDGSLAEIGVNSPAKGKVLAKSGPISITTRSRRRRWQGISTRSGRKLAYALFVNAGDDTSFDDVLDVIDDEGEDSTLIQQLN